MPALDGVDLELRSGEVTLLAGPMGSGKTTLACALAGLIKPQSGSISRGAAQRVGIAFQQPERQLFLESVEEELAFAPRNLGASEGEAHASVRDASALMDIDEVLMPRDPFTLSGGQARRVALAGVLAMQPSVMLFDEPTAALDAPGRRMIHRRVRELAERGVAVLVISHDLEEWLEVADRVALLDQGRVSWTGTPDKAHAEPGVFIAAHLAPPEICQLDLAGAPGRQGGGADGEVGYAGSACADVHEPPSGAASAGDAGTSISKAGSAKASVAKSGAAEPLDPRVVLALTFASVVSIFACPSAVGLACWIVVLSLLSNRVGIGIHKLVCSLRPIAIVVLVILLANLVSCDGQADVMLAAPVGIATSRALRTALVVVRIICMVWVSLIVCAVTTPNGIAEACVRIAAPLRRFKLPVDELGLVLSLTLRCIPLVSEEVMRVRMAEQARGVVFDHGSIAHRVRVWISVFIPVMVGLFRRADRLALAMDARGFGLESARSAHAAPRPLRQRDRIVLGVGIACMAIGTICSILVG